MKNKFRPIIITLALSLALTFVACDEDDADGDAAGTAACTYTNNSGYTQCDEYTIATDATYEDYETGCVDGYSDGTASEACEIDSNGYCETPGTDPITDEAATITTLWGVAISAINAKAVCEANGGVYYE